jgi:hypothetical protein
MVNKNQFSKLNCLTELEMVRGKNCIAFLSTHAISSMTPKSATGVKYLDHAR